MFDNHQAEYYIDIRTKMGLITLLCLLLYLLYNFKFNQDAYTIEKTETIKSLVVNVDQNPIPLGNKNGYMCQLKLPDDSLIELMVITSRIPQISDKIPLTLEYYKNGKKIYTFNQYEWELGISIK